MMNVQIDLKKSSKHELENERERLASIQREYQTRRKLQKANKLPREYLGNQRRLVSANLKKISDSLRVLRCEIDSRN